MVQRKEQQNTKLDVPAIVKFFGGRVELVRGLDQHNIITITAAAIDKWQLRGQIPSARLMDLDFLARAQGRIFRLGNYIRRPRKTKKAA